ncbi:hypothetical protein AgCh_032147 [Apium graveolens]
MELSCVEWQLEWHVTAIPEEIWDSVPQEVLTHLLFFYMDYHRHLERLEEERLEALRQQERIIRLAILANGDRIAYIEKTQDKQQAQIDDILTNQASQQSQLTEIQSSVELLISLLLPADAKKGEKVIKSKCNTKKTPQGKDDGNDDQGYSGMGSGHSQGRRFTSRQASHRTSSDTRKRISSAAGKRISSNELLDLDEEMSRQLFLQENPGMDLESLKEEEARLKSEKITSKSEASGKKSLPKLKGIVIKERTHTEATLARSRPQIDPRSKGKEKVGEPIKVYVPPEEEEITDKKDDLALTSRKVLKTTSDMAQVVQSQEIVSSDIQKKQVTSDRAQVNLISENRSKTLLPGFTKAKQTQSLKTTASGFEARVVTGKEARDKTGLGSADERRVHNTTNDPTSLSEPGIGATPERLNQLESVQMVYHTYLKEYIILYFMTDGRVYHIRQNAIPLKYFEELEHVLLLLQVDDRITETAANYLKEQIQRQKRLYSVKSDSIYVPKYRDHNDDIVDMKPNTAQIRTYLGIKGLEFNLESDKAYVIRLDQELRKAKINDLRAAIFQTGEDTAELKDVKRRMIDELRYAEKFKKEPVGTEDPQSTRELGDQVDRVELVGFFWNNFKFQAGESHLVAIKRTFIYLKGTPKLGIWNGTVKLHFVPNEQQLADIFTKPLDKSTFSRLVSELGLKPWSLSSVIKPLLFIGYPDHSKAKAVDPPKFGRPAGKMWIEMERVDEEYKSSLAQLQCPYVCRIYYTMIQATIVLEDMIKTAYLKKDWWYWSSPSVAAKICTIYGLALRIYAFDAAIIYNVPGAEPSEVFKSSRESPSNLNLKTSTTTGSKDVKSDSPRFPRPS